MEGVRGEEEEGEGRRRKEEIKSIREQPYGSSKLTDENRKKGEGNERRRRGRMT